MPYLTPDEVPEGTVCRPLFIPDDSAWLSLVSGILTEGAKVWNWEKFGTMTPEECAAVIQGIVDRYYEDECGGCELPEGGRIIRLGVNFQFEELSGGEWVSPTGDYELPPIEARTEPTAEERKCIAAANATNVFKELYENLTDSYNLDLDPALALTEWAGRTSTVVFVALGLLSFSAGVILYGVWTLLYAAMEFLTEDVWDEDMDSKMKCALLLAANDDAGVVTFDYRAFMDNLASNTDLGDPSLGELRLFAQTFYMLQILGADGLNQAGATTAITEADCSDCEPFGCYVWEGAELGEWNIDNMSVPPTFNGTEWEAFIQNDGCADHAYIYLNLPFPETTNVGIVRVGTSEAPAGFDTASLQVYLGATLQSIQTATAAPPYDTWGFDFGTLPGDKLVVAFNACNSPTGFTFNSIEINYQGEDIFGTPNCG